MSGLSGIGDFPFYSTANPSTEDIETAAGGDVPPSPPSVVINDLGGLSEADPPVVADQFTAAYYTESAIDSDYIIDDGVLQVPVAGPPGTPAEIIRVHAPVARRVVQWTNERKNQPPRAPASATGNPNETRARKIVRPTTPAMDPKGNHIYRLSGTYEYLLTLAPGDSDALAAGTASYDTTASSANNVQAAQFDSTLLDSSTTVPAGFSQPPSAG